MANQEDVERNVIVQSDVVETVVCETEKTIAIRSGSLVWGKLDPWPWWPGVVVSSAHCGLPPPKKVDYFWIFWFGQHSVSEIPMSKLHGLMVAWNKYSKEGKNEGKNHENAIYEALRALTHILRPALAASTLKKLQSWAQKAMKEQQQDVHLDTFPNWLERSLMKIKRINMNLKKIAKEKEIRTLSLFSHTKRKCKKDVKGEEVTYGASDEDIALVERIKCGTLNIENFCIGCQKEVMGIGQQHPLFRGALCNICHIEIKETSYAIAEDDIRVGCSVCGSTGDCLVCDKDNCSRVYCPYCVELYVGQGAREKIVKISPWCCFLCTPYSEETHGVLQPHADWAKRLRLFLHPNLPAQWSRSMSAELPKIRIVVLHDNLAATYFALKGLGLDFDSYNAWNRWEELNEFNGSQSIRVLKRVDEWREEKWSRLCPIDVLICALPMRTTPSVPQDAPEPEEPPPEQVKRRMPRVGRGTFTERDAGKAFYDFYDIKNAVERNNGGAPLWWAIESVSCYSLTISRFFEMEPIIFDIDDSRGVSSPRYVWTNLPDQDFKPNLVDIYERYHSNTATWSRQPEPLLEKYPWIAEDLEAIRQPLPLDYFTRKKELDRQLYRPETRSLTKRLDDSFNQRPRFAHYSLMPLVQKTDAKSKSRMRKMVRDQGWKIHDQNDDEDYSVTQQDEPFLNNEKYAEMMGFPQYFAHFVGHLEEDDVTERLNRSLPVTLWKHIMKPLQKLAKTIDS